MRTTIDLPENLVNEALKLTKIKTKTDLIKEALLNLIQKEKLKNLKSYRGKINLDIDLNAMRKRWKMFWLILLFGSIILRAEKILMSIYLKSWQIITKS